MSPVSMRPSSSLLRMLWCGPTVEPPSAGTFQRVCMPVGPFQEPWLIMSHWPVKVRWAGTAKAPL